MMNITPFSPAERKALMEELFPLKRTARDYDLRQDMTLDGYIASVIVRAQRQLDSGTLPPHHGDRLACHAGLFQDGNRFC